MDRREFATENCSKVAGIPGHGDGVSVPDRPCGTEARPVEAFVERNDVGRCRRRERKNQCTGKRNAKAPHAHKRKTSPIAKGSGGEAQHG